VVAPVPPSAMVSRYADSNGSYASSSNMCLCTNFSTSFSIFCSSLDREEGVAVEEVDAIDVVGMVQEEEEEAREGGHL